jgi:hypothetical protein
MGKKIILSNIDVHKEQKPRYAKYFNADDFKKVAAILIAESKKSQSYKPNIYYNKAIKENIKELKDYYKNYLNILKSL